MTIASHCLAITITFSIIYQRFRQRHAAGHKFISSDLLRNLRKILAAISSSEDLFHGYVGAEALKQCEYSV